MPCDRARERAQRRRIIGGLSGCRKEMLVADESETLRPSEGVETGQQRARDRRESLDRREFLSMSTALVASARTGFHVAGPLPGHASSDAQAGPAAANAAIQTLTTGEYTITFEKGKNGVTIAHGPAGAKDNGLKLTPCAGYPDWEFWDAKHVSVMKRESAGSVDRVVITSDGSLGVCTFTISVDSTSPGVIHSQVELEPANTVAVGNKYFAGRTPELHYASGKALNKAVYYFNGTPGTTTYHTVADKPSAILDNNQWIYFGDPLALKGTVLYYPNYSSMAIFFAESGTRLHGTVTQPPGCLGSRAVAGDGTVPFGYTVPGLNTPLAKGSKITVSNSLLYLAPGVPEIDEPVKFCSRFVESVSAVYAQLTKPTWRLIEWPAIVEKGLNDLNTQNKVRQQISTHRFLRTNTPILAQANLNSIKKFSLAFSSKTGAEMVQSAGVVWKEIPAPSIAFNDAWQYVYGIAMAADYAIAFDDADARAYCMKSADKVIEAGRHLHYEFPLEVDKTLTPLPSMRFEYDCAGAYVYLMMRYHQFTGEDRYLQEARAAADRVLRSGFEFTYEFTVTSLTPVALLRLFAQTKDKRYLDGISIPLALIVRHSWFFNPGYREYLGRTIFMLTEGMPGVYANGWEEGSLIHQLYALLVEGHAILPSIQRDMVAEILRWKAVSIADSLPKQLPYPSIISRGVPIEWPLAVNHDWEIPMEGFGYFEWDNSGRYQKPGSVSQGPYNFGMLPEAALMLFHPLGEGGVLYADAPIVFETQGDGTVKFATISSQRESLAYVAGRSMTVSIQSDDQGPALRGVVAACSKFWFSIVPGKRYRLSTEAK